MTHSKFLRLHMTRAEQCNASACADSRPRRAKHGAVFDDCELSDTESNRERPRTERTDFRVNRSFLWSLAGASKIICALASIWRKSHPLKLRFLSGEGGRNLRSNWHKKNLQPGRVCVCVCAHLENLTRVEVMLIFHSHSDT